MKKISIIIPCYNIEKYLIRCFSSLQSQTLGFENMEVIFVNDASTDHTWELIRQIEQNYPDNVIAINCETNGRQGRARNIGLTYATAEYIGFVDGDDWVEPEMFRLMLQEMEAHQRDIVYCKFFRDKGEEELQHTLDGSVLHLNIDTEEKRKEFIRSNCLGYCVWNKIYRKSFLAENNIFFPEQVAYEDIFFSSLYYLYAEKVTIINYDLYHYFVNQSSTVLKKNSDYHSDILTVTKLRYEEYQARGVWEKYRQELELDILMAGYIAAVKVAFLRYDKVPYAFLQEFGRFMNQNFPDISKNSYISYYVPQKYRVLLELLHVDVSETELNEIAEKFRRI